MTRKGAVAAKSAVLKRRTFTREFKLQVIREVEAGKSQAQVAREYQVSDNTISKWRRGLRKYKERAFVGRGTLTPMKAASTSRNAWWAHHGERLFNKAFAETGNRELNRKRQLIMSLLQKKLERRIHRK